MKRIILIAAVALMSVAASAQDFKWAYVDFNEIVMLMPKMDEARAVIEENQRQNEETLMSMYEEYQAKMREYQQNADSWTPANREVKERVIMDQQNRLEQTQQMFQQEIQELQQTKQAEVVEDAQKVVQELAASKGLSVVFDKSTLLYIDPAQGIDLTPEARTALNIPADRTLETLQAELLAKQQAAMAAQGR